jgi:hypothetical protein
VKRWHAGHSIMSPAMMVGALILLSHDEQRNFIIGLWLACGLGAIEDARDEIGVRPAARFLPALA